MDALCLSRQYISFTTDLLTWWSLFTKWHQLATKNDLFISLQWGETWCSSALKRSAPLWTHWTRPSAQCTLTWWSQRATTQTSSALAGTPRSLKTSQCTTTSFGLITTLSARRSWALGRPALAGWTSLTKAPGSSPGTGSICCSLSETCRWGEINKTY